MAMVSMVMIELNLVAGIPTPLKHMSSSVGMIILYYSQYIEKKTCSKPPTSDIAQQSHPQALEVKHSPWEMEIGYLHGGLSTQGPKEMHRLPTISQYHEHSIAE